MFTVCNIIIVGTCRPWHCAVCLMWPSYVCTLIAMSTTRWRSLTLTSRCRRTKGGWRHLVVANALIAVIFYLSAPKCTTGSSDVIFVQKGPNCLLISKTDRDILTELEHVLHWLFALCLHWIIVCIYTNIANGQPLMKFYIIQTRDLFGCKKRQSHV